MRAPDGRAFVRNGVGEQLRAGRKTDDVLDRKLGRLRTPDAPGGSLSCTVAAGAYLYAGTPLLYNSWTFDTLPYGGDVEGPSLTSSADDISIVIGKAGWYQFGWKQPIRFTTTGSEPQAIQCELNSERLIGLPDPVFTVILSSEHFGLPGQTGAIIDYTSRWLWSEAGEEFTPKMFWTGTGDPTALSNSGIHLYVTAFA